MEPSSRGSRSVSSTRRAELSPGRAKLPGGAVGWAALIAAVASVPYLILEPASTDLAAQTFRADLWSEQGWVLWNDAWYSGHLVPGYSLLYPPLGALLGPRLVGLLAAACAAAAFAALVRRHRPGRGATLASVWFALGAGTLIYTGRITFMLGLAFGLGALVASRRPPLAAALTVVAAIASPVAGLYTALAGVAMVIGGRVREGVAIAAGGGIATIALIVAFPTGGSQPFGLSSFWWVALACALAVVLIPARMRTLRIGVSIYGALLVALYLVSTPIGSNAPRLGALLAGPVAVLALWGRRPRALALLVLPLLYWQIAAPLGDLLRGAGDPSTEAAFYEPLLAQLEQRAGDHPVRIEIPATRDRWESVYVAERFPLARGWLRQLESTDIGSFTEGHLTPEIYRDWLTVHGVSFVALPRATLDYISEEESELLLHYRLPFLNDVYSDADWTLWEVLPPDGGPARPGAALVDGGARVTELGPDGFSVAVPGPGEYRLRMRYAPYFEVTTGDACVEDAGGVSSRLIVPDPDADAAVPTGPQTIRVDARMSLGGMLGFDRSCSG